MPEPSQRVLDIYSEMEKALAELSTLSEKRSETINRILGAKTAEECRKLIEEDRRIEQQFMIAFRRHGQLTDELFKALGIEHELARGENDPE